jgi:Tfp pilus assembly protein PilO
MFGFIYPKFDSKNQALVDELNTKKAEFDNLQSERKSFELGQRDLKQMATRPYQPQDLFKTDKFLVEAVEQLEQGARESDVEFTLQVSSVSTTTAVKPPKTASGLIAIPYSMEVKGSFANVVSFMERTEHMPFITHVEAVEIRAAANKTVLGSLRAQFYIRK